MSDGGTCSHPMSVMAWRTIDAVEIEQESCAVCGDVLTDIETAVAEALEAL